MRTQALIDLLAAGEAGLPRPAARQRVAAAAAAGLLASMALMWLLLGLHPQLDVLVSAAPFQVRVLFTTAMAAGGLALVWRLGQPGVRAGAWVWLPACTLGATWLLAGGTLLSADAGNRAALVFGDTWQSCPPGIAVLSLPPLAAAFLALRGMAPTAPRAASAAAGLLAGGCGASAYALHCPELALPFVAAWYAAGIAVPVVLATLLGPRVLRW
jgi:hypothetical protein